MLARECVSENAGVAGYAEAFRCVLSGQADKHLVQVFKNRYTSSLRYGRCIADLHRRSYTAHGASGARCAQRIYTALKICQRAYFAKRAREAAKGLIYVFPAGSSRGTDAHGASKRAREAAKGLLHQYT